jgi:hypothetical protein
MAHERSFRLKRAALAIENKGSRRSAVNLSKHEIVHVSCWSVPGDSRMVGIRWRDRYLAMFASDLYERGEEING